MKIICTILVLILSLSFAQAQDSTQPMTSNSSTSIWNLEDCILYGTEHNIGIQRYDLARQDNEIALQTDKYSRLPSLSASVSENYYIGRAQDREGIYRDRTASTTSGGLNASLPIFGGFRINNQIRSDALELDASIADLAQAREDLALQITGFYLNVLFNKELVSIREHQLVLSKELLDQTRIMVENGKTAESELYDAQASVENDIMNLTEARNAVDLSILDLCQAINYQEAEVFDVAAPEQEDVSVYQGLLGIGAEEVSANYANTKPSLAAAKSRVEKSRYDLKLAQSAYYPQLYLGASYSNSYYYTYKLASGTSNSSLADQLGQNGATSIGLTLSIPIFNRMATRNNVRRARLNIRNYELLQEQAHLDMNKEVQQAWMNARAAWQKYQSAGSATEASQKAMDFETEKYRAGRSNTYQYNQVRSRLATSLAEQAQARFTYVFRSKILAFYNGKPLND